MIIEEYKKTFRIQQKMFSSVKNRLLFQNLYKWVILCLLLLRNHCHSLILLPLKNNKIEQNLFLQISETA